MSGLWRRMGLTRLHKDMFLNIIRACRTADPALIFPNEFNQLGNTKTKGCDSSVGTSMFRRQPISAVSSNTYHSAQGNSKQIKSIMHFSNSSFENRCNSLELLCETATHNGMAKPASRTGPIFESFAASTSGNSSTEKCRESHQ